MWTGWPAYQGYFNTEYSTYFREDGFLGVRIGDSEDYVVGVLGEPLEKVWNEGAHTYYYTWARGKGYFYERTITFGEGVVTHKENELDYQD